MFEELRIFLMDNATKEEFDIIEDAFEIFNDYYPPDLKEGFMEYLFTQDESLNDTGQTLINIKSLVREYLQSLLENFEVKLNEEVSLYKLVKITNGLLAIEDYEDKETISNILNLEIDKEERFCEILSLTTELDTSELLLEVEDVSNALLIRISQTLKSTPTKEESFTPDTKAALRIHQYYQFSPNKTLFIFNLLKEGLKVGFDFKTYASIIGRQFEGLDAKDSASALLAMALLSSDAYNNPKNFIHDAIGNYISDLALITQIDIELTTLLLEYQKYIDENKATTTEI